MNRFVGRFLIVFFLCFNGFSDNSVAFERNEIVLYTNEFSLPGLKMDVADRTMEAVAAALAPRRLIVKTVSLPELEKAILQRKADLAIVGSAIYWRNIQNGMRDIATLVTPLQPDPDHAVGALIVTLENRKDINNIEDLKGKHLGVNLPNGFQCFLTLLKDLVDLGYEHKHFFSNVTAYGLLPQKRLDALRRGEVDAVTLNVCYAENMKRKGKDVLMGLKTVGVKKQSHVRCMASTSLYPNWSFLISQNIDTKTIVKIASALYRLPTEDDGQYWSIASSFIAADDLYKTLKIGPYAYLEDWTIQRIWIEYKILILMMIFIFLFAVLHSLRTHYLINLRTRQLKESFEEQQRLQTKAQEISNKYTAIKHAFSVSQLSSLVAHELSQPLASVLLYAQGLKSMMQASEPNGLETNKLKEGIEKIVAQSSRAQEIVKAVRTYAKADEVSFNYLNIGRLLKDLTNQVLISFPQKNIQFYLEIPDEEIWVLGSKLELELAFSNIIQNSLDVISEQKSPFVEIHLSSINEKCCQIVFSDSGPEVSDEILKKIQEPIRSWKPGGLGLGLSIVNAIAEKHMGKLIIDKIQKGGIRVSVTLPMEKRN